MGNSVKGDTPLVLSDGREFTLVLDMEAMLSIEDGQGMPLPKVMTRAQEGYLTATAAIAQAAFSRHQPDMARSDVLDILRTDQEALASALGKAADNAFPKESKKAGKAGKRQAGKTSGSNGAKRG